MQVAQVLWDCPLTIRHDPKYILEGPDILKGGPRGLSIIFLRIGKKITKILNMACNPQFWAEHQVSYHFKKLWLICQYYQQSQYFVFFGRIILEFLQLKNLNSIFIKMELNKQKSYVYDITTKHISCLGGNCFQRKKLFLSELPRDIHKVKG